MGKLILTFVGRSRSRPNEGIEWVAGDTLPPTPNTLPCFSACCHPLSARS